MCDYSLEAFANRKAEVGDKLIITGFTHGFMTKADADKVKIVARMVEPETVCVTCVKKGTVLRLTSRLYDLKDARAKVGRHTGRQYRYALKDYVCVDGRNGEYAIAFLGAGTTATVLSIPGVKPKAKKQSLETRLGLDKLNAKLPTAKEPAKVRAAYKATRKRAPARA